MNKNGAKADNDCGGTTTTTYKAPTPGLDHILFKYGGQMKPGSFKSVMKSMAEHKTGVLRNGGPEATKVIKKQKRPTYKEPEEVPNPNKNDDLKFTHDHDYWFHMDNGELIKSQKINFICLLKLVDLSKITKPFPTYTAFILHYYFQTCNIPLTMHFFAISSAQYYSWSSPGV